MLERMDVVCPDGMPVVWKLNRGLPAGERSAERVSGPDLMEALVRANAEYPGLRHFLLGGDEGTLETLASALKEKYPAFHLAGVHSPPFRSWTEEDRREMREAVASSGANVVWVGLGCPKQERWMAQYGPETGAHLMVGLGGVLDVYAGHVKRAPEIWQKLGLEWCYRLLHQPSRLGRMAKLPLFLLEAAREKGKRGKP